MRFLVALVLAVGMALGVPLGMWLHANGYTIQSPLVDPPAAVTPAEQLTPFERRAAEARGRLIRAITATPGTIRPDAHPYRPRVVLAPDLL